MSTATNRGTDPFEPGAGEARARIHLVRHGEVDPSWKGRVYGALDVPLAPEGQARFDRLAADLAGAELAAVYASDLGRAIDGAARIAARLRVEVRVDPRLREVDRGAWSGLPVEEIEERWPGGLDAYREDPGGYRGHGGENLADLGGRVGPVLDELAEAWVGHQILVVCHAQVIRALLAGSLAIPHRETLRLNVAHGGFTTIDCYADGGRVVQAVNAPGLRDGAWGGRYRKP